MRVKVDADLCTGCGLCVETCPQVFDMSDEEVAVVLVDEVPEDAEDDCRQAAADCPVDAITIE